LTKKYVIFKDDDAGKDFFSLKKWINIIIENNAKGTIGVIGKNLKNKEFSNYLNSLDKNKIEIFCHGYYHSYIPFILRRMIGRNRIFPNEFDRTEKSHNQSLEKFRIAEKRYLKTKAICFGPPGNEWNEKVVEPLIKNNFKMMFSRSKIKGNIFTIPISKNLKHKSIDEFIKDYQKNKNDAVFTLQFHHADLTEEQFDLIEDAVNFLKNEEKRIFIRPSELIGISHKDKELHDMLISKE